MSKKFIAPNWFDLILASGAKESDIKPEFYMVFSKYQGKKVDQSELVESYKAAYVKNHKHLVSKWQKEAQAKGITFEARKDEVATTAANKNLVWHFNRTIAVFSVE
jgi:hypothetical protein